MLISILFPLWQEKQSFPFPQIFFPFLGLIGGILIGEEFPLAVKLVVKKGSNVSKKVGFLNALDLIGGWLGGILGGVLLLPIVGLAQTCIVLIMFKISSLICLFLSLRVYS